MSTSTPNFEEYLAALSQRYPDKAPAVNQADAIYKFLKELAPNCPLPSAAPYENVFCLAWDHGPKHMDFDFFFDGTWEWFYSDKTPPNELDGTETPHKPEERPEAMIKWWKGMWT